MSDSDLQDNYRGVFDGRLGFGQRPAVLVVDFVEAYLRPGSPLYAPDVADAVARTAEVLAAARAKAVPVIYTVVSYQKGGADGGVFIEKVPALHLFEGGGGELGEIAAAIRPDADAGDLVIVKQYASAFFGTSLAATLTSRQRDSVILTGCSTSGCIRASAVDGCQHGYRVIVPRECVADRHAAPHEANLFDIDAKYGDVVAAAEVLDYLDGL